MKLSILAVAATTASLSAAQIQNSSSIANSSSSTACADLHLIVVRASTEQPGQGIIGTLATMISAANPGSSVEAIDYPATLTNYGNSSANGTAQTTKQLKSYVDGCAKAKIVLLGYSQGAHVVGDVMCGGGAAPGLNAFTDPVESKYAEKVVAMIQMGDPRHMANVSWDVGSSVRNGLFPRFSNQTCDKYGSIIQTYCDSGDPFCDGGGNSTVHLLYTQKYNTDAFNFVQKKLAAATFSTTNSSTTTSPTGGASTTSSGSKTSSTASSTSTATNKTNAAPLLSSSAISVLGTSALVAILGLML